MSSPNGSSSPTVNQTVVEIEEEDPGSHLRYGAVMLAYSSLID